MCRLMRSALGAMTAAKLAPHLQLSVHHVLQITIYSTANVFGSVLMGTSLTLSPSPVLVAPSPA